MAIAANAVWEVRTTGDDANGGCFIAGASGTDRSQQDAAHATLTTASTVHTTTTQINVNAADYTVTTADIGNIFQLAGGSATAGFYQITNVDTVNNRWTVDRAAGTSGQTCPGKMGGAIATLGKLSHSSALGTAANNWQVWVKSGTYTLTTTTDGPGGPLFVNNFPLGLLIEGYQTTRGDRAARPLLHAGSVTGLSNGFIRGGDNRSWRMINIEGDANNGVGNTRVFQGNGCVQYQCVARNASAATGRGFSAGSAQNCVAINCAVGFAQGRYANCIAVSCTSVGFENVSGVGFANIAIGCALGFGSASTKNINCIAYGGTDGFTYTAGSGGEACAVNCISYGNSGYGFRSTAGVNGLITLNCAAGNNTSGNFSSCYEEGSITLTADPFTNAAGDDFSLNNAAGGGALLRAAGLGWGDGALYSAPNYLDIGALQHQDAGGGSSGPVGQLKIFRGGVPY